MERDELLRALRTTAADQHRCFGCGYEHKCSIHGCAINRAAAELIEQLAAENEALRNPSNAPLTLEQLREMDGEPVWVVQINGELRPTWMLVDAEDESAADRLYAAMFEDYGTEWLAYRCRPEDLILE